MLYVPVLGRNSSLLNIGLLKILPNFSVNSRRGSKETLESLTLVFLLALQIPCLLNPTSFSPIFVISCGVRIDVTPWLSLSIALSVMPMLARVVALLIVEGGVGCDGEECATHF
jgi:hypothetical protein